MHLPRNSDAMKQKFDKLATEHKTQRSIIHYLWKQRKAHITREQVVVLGGYIEFESTIYLLFLDVVMQVSERIDQNLELFPTSGPLEQTVPFADNNMLACVSLVAEKFGNMADFRLKRHRLIFNRH